MQFNFLKEQDLKPDDRLLEIGCDVLRADKYIVEYLEAG